MGPRQPRQRERRQEARINYETVAPADPRLDAELVFDTHHFNAQLFPRTASRRKELTNQRIVGVRRARDPAQRL